LFHDPFAMQKVVGSNPIIRFFFFFFFFYVEPKQAPQ